MSANARLTIGIGLLVIGLVMPLGVFLVAATDWHDGLKAVVSGVLFFGMEIMAIPAAAVMGKENYQRIVHQVLALLMKVKPTGKVSRTRYTVGLVLLVVPVLFGWITSYVPSWLPAEYVARVWVNLGVDLILVASLFVLGGDFWDKLRALFVYEARVEFPAPPEA